MVRELQHPAKMLLRGLAQRYLQDAPTGHETVARRINSYLHPFTHRKQLRQGYKGCSPSDAPAMLLWVFDGPCSALPFAQLAIHVRPRELGNRHLLPQLQHLFFVEHDVADARPL